VVAGTAHVNSSGSGGVSLFDEARMRGQTHQEERPVFVGFEDGRQETVLLPGLEHLRDTGAAALCKDQLGILAGTSTHEAFRRRDGSPARLCSRDKKKVGGCSDGPSRGEMHSAFSL
jgi:hypothetical protein